MCTAITFKTKDHYFGRNLDLEYSFYESIIITPRKFPLKFRMVQEQKNHYAMIGAGIVRDNFPLYYDATNEAGLSIAALNFPGNAVYHPKVQTMENVASYELIPWILGQCATVTDAEILLKNANITAEEFCKALPSSPLHWIIADRESAVTVESREDGLHIITNPVGILTNNPPFEYHIHNLNNYLNLTREESQNHFAPSSPLMPHSRGLGAFGLPGDLSSPSRFIKAAFTKLNSVSGDSEEESVTQFFHILSSVEQQSGCVRVGKDFEKTVYTSCCNTDTGVYYYVTYENRQITAIDMHREHLESDKLIHYPMIRKQQIHPDN